MPDIVTSIENRRRQRGRRVTSIDIAITMPYVDTIFHFISHILGEIVRSYAIMRGVRYGPRGPGDENEDGGWKMEKTSQETRRRATTGVPRPKRNCVPHSTALRARTGRPMRRQVLECARASAAFPPLCLETAYHPHSIPSLNNRLEDICLTPGFLLPVFAISAFPISSTNLYQ